MSSANQLAVTPAHPQLQLAVGHLDLIEATAAGIHAGLVLYGWMPADLAACQHKGETIDSMLWRFARERARNIVAPFATAAMMAQIEAEEAEVAA